MVARKVRKLRRALEPYWARVYARLAPPLDLAHAAPVLVLGNQKTGSSAVAHLLAARGGLRLAADVHPAQGHEADVGRFDTSDARAFVQGAARYYFGHDVVKENALTPATGALLGALPQARSVFVVRHPVQNIRSLLDRLDLPGTPQPLEDAMHGLAPGWRDVMTNAGLNLDAPGDHITALAQRWAALARLYDRHRERLHLARYEDFTADKTGFVEGLADRLGIAPRQDVRPLVDVDYQPRGAHRGDDPRQFFSPEALDLIEATCARERRALGYDDAVSSAPPAR